MQMRYTHGVYIADTARVLGDVNLGQDVNIWYGASIRGDVATVTIGDRSNVQDNAVIHCDFGFPNVIGSDVVIGHGAVVHGEYVGDGTLIGMGAVLLGRTRIGKGCVVAAGAIVPPGMVVPDGMLVMGVPAKVGRPVNDDEKAFLKINPPHYIELAKLHATQPDHPRVKAWAGNAAPDAAALAELAKIP